MYNNIYKKLNKGRKCAEAIGVWLYKKSIYEFNVANIIIVDILQVIYPFEGYKKDNSMFLK